MATQRLSLLPDRRLLYRLKRRWRDGTTHVVFEPLEFLEKLAALVPPPRIHQVRYHGILGPAAGHRGLVVPGLRDAKSERAGAAPTEASLPRAAEPASPSDADNERVLAGATLHPRTARAGSCPAALPPSSGRGGDPHASGPRPASSGRNLSWAELIRRVFIVDVLECPKCGGRMKILAAIQTPEAIRAILENLGLPSRAPPTSAAVLPMEDPSAEAMPMPMPEDPVD